MRKETFNFEIETIVEQFANAFNDIVIRRYNDDRDIVDKIHVNFVYAPKTRVIYDLVNKSQHIQLPVVAIFPRGIRRDPSRVFNKLEGSYVTLSPQNTGVSHVLQPVPVDITVSMSILARFQSDIDQIITNFVPYVDPYVIVSWKHPYIGYEIRSQVLWDGNLNYHYPEDITANQYYRLGVDTTFTIKGWLFKAQEVDAGKIYTIYTDFTSVSSIFNNWEVMERTEGIYTTDYWVISGRPTIDLCDPFLIVTSANDVNVRLIGTQFNYVSNLYISGSPGVYPLVNYYNPLSGSHSLSASYPGFSAVAITSWNVESNNLITFHLPSAIGGGFIDIIAGNEAGYSKMTVDGVRTTNNPYPTSHPNYSTYTTFQYPSISGIEVIAFG